MIASETKEKKNLESTLAPFLGFFSEDMGFFSVSAFLLRPLET